MNNITKSIYPYLVSTREHHNQEHGNDERIGFLLPFITGAAITAPLWYTAGINRPNYNPPVYYPVPYYPPMYYQPYPYRPPFNPIYRPPYWRQDEYVQ